MDKSFDFVVSVLAVLKTGAAFLPIESTLQANRKLFMMNDGDVVAVLTNSSTM